MDGRRTNLESELLEGVGETRERLVTGTGLCDQGQGSGGTVNLPVGDLHTGSLGDIVLEGWVGSRGHGPAASGERTRRISAKGGPRQHDVSGAMDERGEEIRTLLGFEEGGRQLREGKESPFGRGKQTVTKSFKMLGLG